MWHWLAVEITDRLYYRPLTSEHDILILALKLLNFWGRIFHQQFSIWWMAGGCRGNYYRIWRFWPRNICGSSALVCFMIWIIKNFLKIYNLIQQRSVLKKTIQQGDFREAKIFSKLSKFKFHEISMKLIKYFENFWSPKEWLISSLPLITLWLINEGKLTKICI